MLDFVLFFVIMVLTEILLFYEGKHKKTVLWITTTVQAAYILSFGLFAAIAVLPFSLLEIATCYLALVVAIMDVYEGAKRVFLNLMLLLVLLIVFCIVFGASYSLKNVPESDIIFFMIERYDWNNHFSLLVRLFAQGFRGFFVSIDPYDISDPHVLQRGVGCVLSFVIVPWTVSAVKKALEDQMDE